MDPPCDVGALGWLVGSGGTGDSFLREAWGRSARLLPGAAGRFDHLLDWTALAHALRARHRDWYRHRRDQFLPPRLSLARDGSRIPVADRLGVEGTEGLTGLLSTAELHRHLRAGATLYLNGIDELVRPVGRLCDELEGTLGEPVTAAVFAGGAARSGFDLHLDRHDSFIVQVRGRRRWQVWVPTRPSPLETDVEWCPEPTGAPIIDAELDDGDVLYIPRGWWHRPTGVGVPCLHLAVNVACRTGIDLVEWLVDEVGSELQNHLVATDGRQDPTVAELREALVGALDDRAVDRFLDHVDTHRPATRPRRRVFTELVATAERSVPRAATPGALP